MIYIKEIPSQRIEDALVLDEQRAARIKQVIDSAYHQYWPGAGPNIDQINAFVAHELHTPEEAFYAAVTIISDVVNAMNESKKNRRR